ncbi:MAG: hypothetical protein HC853_01535 [Anaerolineae bacterium]|nr:hypothetical protein [Anaerolineae bacterium]
MKVSKSVARLLVLVVTLVACKTDPARVDYVRKQAYDLGAKLGDSPATRLGERFQPSTPVSGTDQYYLFFTTKDSQEAFRARLTTLGSAILIDSRTTPVEEGGALHELGLTGVLTQVGPPLITYTAWNVEGISAVFHLYEVSTLAKASYLFNEKPITDNVVMIFVMRTKPLAKTQTKQP